MQVNTTHGSRLVVFSLFLGAVCSAEAQVNTYFGVTAQLWTSGVPGNMKMDYDGVNNRLVVQYQYFSYPPKYGTVDLVTKTFQHLAQPAEGEYYETLFTVLPTSWAGLPAGTVLTPRGGGGKIFSIHPSGSPIGTFATGLPGGGTGTHYSTVRWDSFGVAGNDLFYANEGTGSVVRVDSTGSIVWQTTLYDGQNLARPEPMIVLGSNPRWGSLQNHVIVGQNNSSTTFFAIDPATGVVSNTLNSTIGGSLESFRLYQSGTDLYVSIFGSGIYKLSNLTNIPGVTDNDLFVARELSDGGEIWHVVWNGSSFTTQKIADFHGAGWFLEDMTFAPVPEPSSLLAVVGLLGIACRVRRGARKRESRA